MCLKASQVLLAYEFKYFNGVRFSSFNVFLAICV